MHLEDRHTALSMQDNTAGIAIYIPSEIHNPEQVDLKPGDQVRLTGVLTEFLQSSANSTSNP